MNFREFPEYEEIIEEVATSKTGYELKQGNYEIKFMSDT